MKSPCSYYRSSACYRWRFQHSPYVCAAGTGQKNFEAEIQTALELAKAVAGFEFLGTLVQRASYRRAAAKAPATTCRAM